MTQNVKAASSKTDSLGFSPETHMVDAENLILQVSCWPLQEHYVPVSRYMYTYKPINKIQWKQGLNYSFSQTLEFQVCLSAT